MPVTTPEYLGALKAFRDRMGGISEEKKAWARQQKQALTDIRAALKAGPRTIPEIAAETHRPGHEILWYIMAMKRYGKVAERGLDGDYFRYELKEAKP